MSKLRALHFVMTSAEDFCVKRHTYFNYKDGFYSKSVEIRNLSFKNKVDAIIK